MVQLYAQNSDGVKVFVESAFKGTDYFCLECLQKVRLRGGMYRQLHFYHMEEGKKCSQREKTIEHILVQKTLQKYMPEVQLEVRFPEIGRIADAMWQERNIVFEVQVSPMSEEECLARITDYKKAGFDVVFILHTKTYGRRLATPMEFVLKNYTHYFTDIDEMGGEIFDMLSWLSRGRRLFLQGSSLSRCVINIASIEKRELCSSNAVLEVLKEREQGWLLQASGDLLSKKLREDHEREAVDIEQCLYRSQKREVSGVKWCWHLLQSFHKKIVESCL